MGIPKDPRQAMINMMYLVLTALLALNISSEVLNAFSTVNEGMEAAIISTNRKKELSLAALNQKAQSDDRAKEMLNVANRVVQFADSINHQIEEIKRTLLQRSGYNLQNGKMVASNPRDNYTPQRMMINENTGRQLAKMIRNSRTFLLEMYPPAYRNSADERLRLRADSALGEGNIPLSWEEKQFTGVPVVAAQLILTSIQNDLRLAEADLLDKLRESVNATDFFFDKLVGRAIAERNYLTIGQSYKAELLVTGINSASRPVVYLGSLDPARVHRTAEGDFEEIKGGTPPLLKITKTYETSEKGIIRHEEVATQPGNHQLEGVIAIARDGVVSYFPFEQTFQVAPPMSVVSPDKLNVLYRGVENPVSVSVPGYAADNIEMNIDNGALTKTAAGKYTAKVSAGNSAHIAVSVRHDGAVKNMGIHGFIVKSVPDPLVQLGGQSSGGITAGLMRSMVGLIAHAPDFPFDARYQILGFKIFYQKYNTIRTQDAVNNGAIFNTEGTDLVKRAATGDRYWFEDIRIKYPDGIIKTFSLAFRIIG